MSPSGLTRWTSPSPLPRASRRSRRQADILDLTTDDRTLGEWPGSNTHRYGSWSTRTARRSRPSCRATMGALWPSSGLRMTAGDASSVPGPGPEVMSGRAAVVRGLEPVLASGGKMSLVSVVAIRNGDLALTHTKVRLTLPGREPWEAPVGSAEVARRQADGTWRYVIDNSLGPAILDGGWTP